MRKFKIGNLRKIILGNSPTIKHNAILVPNRIETICSFTYIRHQEREK